MDKVQHKWQIIAIIGLGLMIRGGIAPLGGHPGDVPVLAQWAGVINEQGLLAIYALSSANYPPLGMLMIAVAAGIVELLDPAQALNPTGALWLCALKLPAMLADGALIWLVWRMCAAHHRRALWLALSVALNPALIYMSGWWGQLESVYVLCALLALWSAHLERDFMAGIWLALAVLSKQQGAVIVPVVLLMLLARHAKLHLREWLVFVAGGLMPVAVLTLPFILTGQGMLLARRLVALVAAPGWLTVNALNFWYLITAGTGNWAFNAPLVLADTRVFIAGLTARQMGMVLLIGWSLFVMWSGWHRRGQGLRVWILCAGLLYLGVFLWPTQAHERYAFAAVPLLAGALSATNLPASRRESRMLLILYGGLTVTYTLNLIWAAPFDPVLLAKFAGNVAVGMALAGSMLVLSLGQVRSLYKIGRESELELDDYLPDT